MRRRVGRMPRWWWRVANPSAVRDWSVVPRRGTITVHCHVILPCRSGSYREAAQEALNRHPGKATGDCGFRKARMGKIPREHQQSVPSETQKPRALRARGSRVWCPWVSEPGPEQFRQTLGRVVHLLGRRSSGRINDPWRGRNGRAWQRGTERGHIGRGRACCPEPQGLKASDLSLWQVLTPRLPACRPARSH